MRTARHMLVVSLSIAFVVLSTGSSFTAEVAVPHPNLAGHWILNIKESEDARAKMRDARGDRDTFSGRRPGGRGGRMGGGMGRRRGGAPAGGGRSDADRDLRDGVFRPAHDFALTQTEREIVISETDGVMRILHPDGREGKALNGAVKTVAKWEGEALVVESKTERGMKVKETFSLLHEKPQLGVVVQLEGGRFPSLTVRRVYDPAGTADSPMATSSASSSPSTAVSPQP